MTIVRTVIGGSTALALALTAMLGTAGSALATFSSPASTSASVGTLTLQPPSGAPKVLSCSASGLQGVDRTLVVSVPASPTEAVVATRPTGTRTLSYVATASYSAGFLTGSGTTSATVASSGAKTYSLSLSAPGGYTRTWSVSVTTTDSGWTSTAVTTTSISC